MEKRNLIYAMGLSAFLMGSSALAAAPANMVVDNNTYLISTAYVHDVASGAVLAPKTSAAIPWSAVTTLCHGASASLKGSDSCAFDVYATSDSMNPKQIHVATVTFYVSDGETVNIAELGLSYGLKVVAVAPGKFELNNV